MSWESQINRIRNFAGKFDQRDSHGSFSFNSFTQSSQRNTAKKRKEILMTDRTSGWFSHKGERPVTFLIVIIFSLVIWLSLEGWPIPLSCPVDLKLLDQHSDYASLDNGFRNDTRYVHRSTSDQTGRARLPATPCSSFETGAEPTVLGQKAQVGTDSHARHGSSSGDRAQVTPGTTICPSSI